MLNGWGCDVATARDLDAALAAVRDGAPEAILADYHLDEGNGLEAIAALRDCLGRDTPAVLLTADRSLAVRDAAAALERAGARTSR